MELPHTITITFYSGGETVYKKNSAFWDMMDSITYSASRNGDKYVASKMFRREIYVDIRDSLYKPLNDDPYWSTEVRNTIDSSNIRGLMLLLDTANYVPYFIDEKMKRKGRDTMITYSSYKHIAFGLLDYGIDMRFYDCFCEMYRTQIIEKEKIKDTQYGCNDTTRLNAFLHKVLDDNLNVKVVSSYVTYLTVVLKFKQYKIEAWQSHTGEFNTSWKFNINGSRWKSQQILSPGLNQAIYNMLPDGFRMKESLIEHKDPYLLYRKILTGW